MKFAIKVLTAACVLPFSHANAARPIFSSTRNLHHRMALSLPTVGFSNAAFLSPSSSHVSSKHLHQKPFSLATNCQSRNLSTTGYFSPTLIQVGSTFLLFASPDENESPTETKSDTQSTSIVHDAQSIATLVGAQGLLIPISIALAKYLDLTNMGLGSSFCFGRSAFVEGVQWTVPLFALAGIMKLIEPYSPALQDVTRATQRSVLAVMGSKRRPLFAILVSILLGAVAGWGEEWLFRGVFQTKLSTLFGNEIALAVSGLVFGLLHAVTPIYATLAGAASVFFGYLYNQSNNLAVPMVCHAVYDVGALLWAHYSVTALSKEEQEKIMEGGRAAPILSTTINDAP